MKLYQLQISLALLLIFTACATTAIHKGEGTLRIYLARHGQTDWNLQKRLQGSTDIALNETGRKQAMELHTRLQNIALERIYCSSLRRSKETAEIVSAGNIPVTVLPDLNEQSMGIFEGKYVDGRDAALMATYEKRTADPDDTMDGGESLNEHFARVRSALARIRENHKRGGAILIVGHGGTNSLILRTLLQLTSEEADEIHQDNSELYLIELPPSATPIIWKQIPPALLNEL